MKITPYFLLSALVLVAPHLSEKDAKFAATICLAFGLIFWAVELWLEAKR